MQNNKEPKEKLSYFESVEKMLESSKRIEIVDFFKQSNQENTKMSNTLKHSRVKTATL